LHRAGAIDPWTGKPVREFAALFLAMLVAAVGMSTCSTRCAGSVSELTTGRMEDFLAVKLHSPSS
jgi:hypothetical protein